MQHTDVCVCVCVCVCGLYVLLAHWASGISDHFGCTHNVTFNTNFSLHVLFPPAEI